MGSRCSGSRSAAADERDLRRAWTAGELARSAGIARSTASEHLTAAGRAWFADLGGEDALHPRGRRPLVRTCVDWTERRSHLGGALGATLCDQLLHRGWITHSATGRGVTLTPAGADALHDRLGLEVAADP